MQKKCRIVILTICLAFSTFLIWKIFESKYSLVIKKIDNYSPDRLVEVYKNGKKIEFKYLEYVDGTVMCTGKNPTVSYIDLIDVDTVTVVLDDNRIINIKISDK